jgi:hypothetical protein
MSLTTQLGQTACHILGLPFDLARINYAQAVRLGFIEHSLLKSARFEKELTAIERLTLGPWARQV